MREIKFRAWDKRQKYMAYQGAPDLETIQSFVFHFGDEELMQFIGLHDVNGSPIYECDIVKYIGEIGCSVVAYVGTQFVRSYRDNGLGYDIMPFRKHHNYEVIGNIYQNPDLLK